MGHSQILPRPITDRRQIVDATNAGRSQGPPATETSADHVRNHPNPSTDPPSSEAERSANKRPEAAPAANSAESADDDQRIVPLLVIATILTIPTFVVTMLMLGSVTMPDWLTNPWLHAIVITPVMFIAVRRFIATVCPPCINARRMRIR